MERMGKLTMNTSNLFEYGIQSEETTHRIHVDPAGGFVYSFRTDDGVTALPEPVAVNDDSEWECNGYRLVCWRYDNKATARGIRIPWLGLKGCVRYEIPEDLRWAYWHPSNKATTSERGRAGENIALEMLKRGLISLIRNTSFVVSKRDQILGSDITEEKVTIQVKFDKYATRLGIFLQTHEWNPRKEF